MAFRTQRAMAIFWKDWIDLLKNKALLGSMFALPVVLVVIPTFVVRQYAGQAADPALRAMAMYYEPNLDLTVNAAQFLIEKTLVDWFGLYLIMPVFVPILISSQSVAGEKERRTLEPLLASPVTAGELVAGKSLAAMAPAVGICWLAFIFLCAGVNWAAWPLVHAPVLPNKLWLFGVLVVAPLFAFFGNGVAVLVSARVAEARLAQQVSALVVLPLLGLVGGQVAGVLKAGPAYYAIQGAVVLLLDVILVALSVKLFDRERLISRWL